MLDHLPLVTVNILSFNRKNELRNTLTKVYEQDYKNIEVIVVDNASSDGSPEMVANEFPAVILIRMQKNIGIAGWNEGFKIASGEYVLVLDDDSYPENEVIYTASEYFKEHVTTAVVGFAVYNQNFNIIENDEFKYHNSAVSEDVNGFIGCGALIRKSAFAEVNGYDNNLFLYYNELEVSIRLINRNYKIAFFSNHRIIHTYSKIGRNIILKEENRINEKRFFYGFISYWIFLFKNFSLFYFIVFSVKLLISNLIIAIRMKYIKSYFRGLYKIINLLDTQLLFRKPVSYAVQKRYAYGNFKFNNIYIFNR
ncbi:MAG: glycosyltransferase family 2 protein [Ignavibacteria bacterium]|nr:glycosyltransferase family 2 protein [Ignavibacteria bacterium]